jgi:hypothetical protein
MLPNLNSLMSSATALVFRSLNEIQVLSAEMNIKNQQLMKDLLTAEPELFHASLSVSQKQAGDEIQQGWVQFGENLGQAAATLGTCLIGNIALPSGEASPQMKVEAEEDEENIEMNPVRPELDAEISDNEEAVIGGQNNVDENENRGKSEEKKLADEKEAFLKKQTAIESSRTYLYQVIAPNVGAVVTSAFKAGEGYVQAKITTDQATAQFVQGFCQMEGQAIGQTAANIQSKEQQEQAAAQAFLQAEQLSSSRG